MGLKAVSKIKHNGQWFEPGETLKKVSKEDTERLVELGAAKEDSKKEEKE